ncbi:hypothetical protein D9619_003781 [Psilocybe cf. subviscida]|uniref:Glycosyltransferase family 1 protein n=1 Tax=Psilocybe cf. subviscida TaxID=2480587 RepID=A0A8H5ETI0_9AGAR|nr:hypothetical protein D9619_003781 [Psilocybe cf. subviscida]
MQWTHRITIQPLPHMSYHVLLVSIPAWGHVRPLLALAVRLLLERDDIILTILVSPNMLDKSFSDLELQFAHNGSQSAAKRVRLLTTFIAEPTDQIFAILAKAGQAYPPVYNRLVAGEAVTCAAKGTVFDACPSPVAIIMDFFALAELQATRSITGDTIPVTAIVASGAAPIIQLFGPESIGGFGNVGPRIDAEVARTGRDPIEVGEEIFHSVKGAVSRIPGLPEMYDYESFPQKLTSFGPTSIVARAGYSFLEEADGLILTTSKAYEMSGTLRALETYRLDEMNKVTFAIGPLLPLQYSSGQLSNRGDEAIASFLADKLEKFGEKSVLFMSFGTVVWPESSDYVEEVIDCMIEKKLPFIFCYAFPFAELPESLIAKVNASGLGYLSKWAPQQYILTHPATGWYLTHCGWGGVTEALGAGVPMIAWPFMADQPHNAAHLSENLKVAIELVEVRTGENGLKPMRRNGRAAKGTRAAVREEFLDVIDDMRGAKGAQIRANVQGLKGHYAKAWQEEGDAKLELQAFLKRFVLRD